MSAWLGRLSTTALSRFAHEVDGHDGAKPSCLGDTLLPSVSPLSTPPPPFYSLQHARGALDATTAAMVKSWTTDLQVKVADRCVQIFGTSNDHERFWLVPFVYFVCLLCLCVCLRSRGDRETGHRPFLRLLHSRSFNRTNQFANPTPRSRPTRRIQGGWGYMWEYPICRAFVDSRVQPIYGGTNEIMKELIGRSL